MSKFNDNMMKENCLIKSKTLDKCFICGELTQYIDYISEGRICSTECMNQFYSKLNELENRISGTDEFLELWEK